jgi:hypothetical protein
MSSGNFVADYEEMEVVCDECEGEGLKEASKEELIEYFEERNFTLKMMLALYRSWKKDGSIICSVCDGVGTEIVKI